MDIPPSQLSFSPQPDLTVTSSKLLRENRVRFYTQNKQPQPQHQPQNHHAPPRANVFLHGTWLSKPHHRHAPDHFHRNNPHAQPRTQPLSRSRRTSGGMDANPQQ